MSTSFDRKQMNVLMGIVAMLGIACSSKGEDIGSQRQAAGKPVPDTGGDGADGGTLACLGESSGALNTFIGATVGIQIDQIGSGFGPNADLFSDFDHADNSPSGPINKPTFSGATVYKDWDDYGGASIGNHRILDVYSGKDATSFPGNDSCTGPANNPPKDELVYVGAANNNDFLYLNVLRASSLGDMGYTWLFTREKPTCGVGGNNDSCPTWMRFKISAGDVLIFGHFRTGTTKLLNVFTPKLPAPVLPVDATNAIDWGSGAGLWTEDLTAAAAVAVNEDVTGPGSWGIAGVKSPDSGNLEDHIFAEGAVGTGVFGGGGSVCGKQFWVTVISKSSGNTASGADVKDYIGPKRVNFGSIVASATADSNCDGTANLKASATDGADPPVALSVTCKWYDVASDGSKALISSACNPTSVPLTPGTHNLSVTLTSDTGCTETKDVSVDVLGPIVLTVTPDSETRSCTSNPAISTDVVTFTASATGGKGPYTFTWTGCTKDPSDQSKCTVDPAGAFCKDQTVTVKADDSSACPETGLQSRTYHKETTVTVTNP